MEKLFKSNPNRNNRNSKNNVSNKSNKNNKSNKSIISKWSRPNKLIKYNSNKQNN